MKCKFVFCSKRMNTTQTIKINMTLTINIILLNNVDRFYTAR